MLMIIQSAYNTLVLRASRHYLVSEEISQETLAVTPLLFSLQTLDDDCVALEITHGLKIMNLWVDNIPIKISTS